MFIIDARGQALLGGRLILARIIAAVGLLLTVIATADGQSPAMQDSLDTMRAAFVRAYNAGDVTALESLYVDDAVRMVYDAPAQHGKPEIREALRSSFASRRAAVNLALRPEEVYMMGDMAIERGSYHEVWQSPGISAPPSHVETGKYVTLARRSSGWKYAWSIFNRDSAPPRRTPIPATAGVLSGTTVTPARWQPWGQGLEMAPLEGDHTKPGRSYTIALRLAPGRWIRPHWHPLAKQIYVVSGTLLFGHGQTLDTTNTTPLPPGTVASVPAEHAHYEGARVATVVLLSGIGPLQTNMIPQQQPASSATPSAPRPWPPRREPPAPQ